jgi:hypothetical protein
MNRWILVLMLQIHLLWKYMINYGNFSKLNFDKNKQEKCLNLRTHPINHINMKKSGKPQRGKMRNECATLHLN